ncbi:hypothetical protein C4D60_Mb03t03070 [Musa balbisiana]|uniref:Pentatricopeptide repeat-containing protein n=1 Tax=Musa balbisiana TaxID=52838 RepID=A0A4S8J8W3_MUSBA|nr:hypothetical protein C4D60_Mb03t03070 [Musa balbisiana]
MPRRNVSPDKFTFPFILKACASAAALREGHLEEAIALANNMPSLQSVVSKEVLKAIVNVY